jgi:hypothetical protein
VRHVLIEGRGRRMSERGNEVMQSDRGPTRVEEWDGRLVSQVVDCN